MDKYKCVIDLRVVNDLVAKDFPLVHIEVSEVHPDKLIYVFVNSPELEAEISGYKTMVAL